MMGVLISIIVIVIIAAVLMSIFSLLVKKEMKKLKAPLFCKKQFLTPNEKEFFRRLQKAIEGTEFVIYPQVAMGALIDSALKKGSREYFNARFSFQSKICDFVICSKITFDPVAIVELDDVTHDVKKDVKRDNMTIQAGIPTIRFWSRNKPEPNRIREILDLEVFSKLKA